MKNLKNMISATGLMAVMAVGAISANAGLLISDRTAPGADAPCTVKDGGSSFDGIIIVGLDAALDGIIIVGRDGLLLSDKGLPCNPTDKSRDGLLITD